jgi:hypothetical protein
MNRKKKSTAFTDRAWPHLVTALVWLAALLWCSSDERAGVARNHFFLVWCGFSMGWQVAEFFAKLKLGSGRS